MLVLSPVVSEVDADDELVEGIELSFETHAETLTAIMRINIKLTNLLTLFTKSSLVFLLFIYCYKQEEKRKNQFLNYRSSEVSLSWAYPDSR